MQNIKRYRFFILLILVVIAYSNRVSAQYNFSLNYEEFDIFFSPKKCVDTIEFTLKGRYAGYKLKLYLKDCKGEAHFKLFDKKNGLRMSGNYDNAIDTLKKYRLGRYLAQPEGVEKYSISAIRYLYPLKAGEWVYYEGEGKRKKSRTVTYVYTTEQIDKYNGKINNKKLLADGMGVIYRRINKKTGKAYIEQTKSTDRYGERIKEHERANPDDEFEFEIIGTAKEGKDLDVLEETMIRKHGTPKKDIDNKRHQMSDKNYNNAGGTESKPGG